MKKLIGSLIPVLAPILNKIIGAVIPSKDQQKRSCRMPLNHIANTNREKKMSNKIKTGVYNELDELFGKAIKLISVFVTKEEVKNEAIAKIIHANDMIINTLEDKPAEAKKEKKKS